MLDREAAIVIFAEPVVQRRTKLLENHANVPFIFEPILKMYTSTTVAVKFFLYSFVRRPPSIRIMPQNVFQNLNFNLCGFTVL